MDYSSALLSFVNVAFLILSWKHSSRLSCMAVFDGLSHQFTEYERFRVSSYLYV